MIETRESDVAKVLRLAKGKATNGDGKPHKHDEEDVGALDPRDDPLDVQAEIAARRQTAPDENQDAEPTASTPAKPPSKDGAWQFRPITSRELLEGDFRPRWLVKRVLVANEPIIVGAPQKALKTGLMIDLALSLGSGTPFLNRFDVPQRVRVALLSGESGRFTLQETAKRIARSKDIDLAAADVFWGFDLPQLGEIEDVAELADGLKARGVELVIVDPLYLSLLTAAAGPESSRNVFAIGPLLLSITRRCAAVGVTTALVHHSNRSIPAGEPMELSSLSGAGCAEFAAQWLLLNRREAYRSDGNHSLWLNAGGRTGQGGLYALTIREGTLNEDFTGRGWDVEVDDAPTAFKKVIEGKEAERRDRELDKSRHEQDAVMLALDAEVASGQAAATKTRLKERTKYSTDKIGRAITALVDAGLIQEVAFSKTVGNGASRQATGFKRVDE